MAAVNRLLRFASVCSTKFTRTLCVGAIPKDEVRIPSLFPPSPVLPRGDIKNRNAQWVFLGCPGVGKGTYASRLSKLLGVPHIATGDLVREELSSSGPLCNQVIFLDCLSSRLKLFSSCWPCEWRCINKCLSRLKCVLLIRVRLPRKGCYGVCYEFLLITCITRQDCFW